ncbi:OsmC family protein [Dethiobacter alkaliphilus]|uniref:OsmC family protein n=1 Tax=Dethiobacter alkaliphilus TaxID=427926 RepID=UPI00222743AF|nr:OsmC family protein [Dethiobacter alkaliphilus]MCW3489610.1 OsmC family protein [Dethiobacter alkaliphilus]
MSSVKVKWQNDLYFQGVSASGQTVQLEGATGTGQGVRPSEMLLLALGGCTGMDIVSLLQKFEARLDHFQVELGGEKHSQHPKSFRTITAVYHISGDVTPQQAWKAVSSSYNKYSVIANSLQANVEYRVLLNGEEITEK